MSDPNRLSELAAHCIRCGFCLESCPTFIITGSELESPRGRIYLARSAMSGKLDWTKDVEPHLDQCLGCRGCETACPSGVEYGQILELARSHLGTSTVRTWMIDSVSDHRKLKFQLLLGSFLPGKRIPNWLSKLVSSESPEVDLPQKRPRRKYPELDKDSLPPVRGEVYLLEGCAMRVLYPGVHEATRRLLRRLGYSVREAPAQCCGALHAHAGLLDEAKSKGRALAKAFKDDIPIIVNSAGCGSAMKEYSSLDPDLMSVSVRTRDVSEFLLDEGLEDLLRDSPGVRAKATYHDACHLAHGQRITQPPRALLGAVPGLDVVPLAESDLCCGSAGTYNVFQPTLARQLLDRKWKNIESTGAQIVVLGNPGCHGWIAQAAKENGSKVTVLHTVEVLEESFCNSGTAHF